MTYDLDHELEFHTRWAYEELLREGLTDLTDDKAKSIIADHAKDAVPAGDEALLSVYMQHGRALYMQYRHALMDYGVSIPTQCDTGSPYINTEGLRIAIYRLVVERMHDKLDDLINAD